MFNKIRKFTYTNASKAHAFCYTPNKSRVSKLGSAAITLALVSLMVTSPAFAQVDTAESSLSSIQDWLDTWIPLAMVLGIIVGGLTFAFGFLRLDWFVRSTIGMIVIGSAAYIVGFFGFTGSV